MGYAPRKIRSGETRYRLETVVRACELLKAFAHDHELLTLAEISARTGFEKTIAFRLVHTLEQEGLLRSAGERRYSSNIQILNTQRFRLGYAAQTGNSSFSAAVTESIRWAATKSHVDLLALDNNYSAKTALRNANRLIAERVDIAIEFQAHERVASTISSMFQAAGIPLIAIDIPHPGATLFGVDNYRAGMAAGRAAVRAAKRYWQGAAEELLLLELDIAGSLPYLRTSGAEASIREELPVTAPARHIETRGDFLRSFDAVRRHLQRSPARRTIIAGVNDHAVLGALRAFEEAGRSEFCVAVGLGAIPEARKELRSPRTRLAGSIALFFLNTGVKASFKWL